MIKVLLLNENRNQRSPLGSLLDAFQQNLSKRAKTYDQFILVPCLSPDCDWEILVESLELHKVVVLVVFEENPGGSDEILYPEGVEADKVGPYLHALRQKQRQQTLLKKQAEQRKQKDRREAKIRRRQMKKKQAGRS